MKMPSPFVCRTCGISFSSKTNWKRHEKQSHRDISEIDKFDCPECGRQFIRKHDLSRHIVARHTDLSKEQHRCPQCGKVFGRESLLKKHTEVHEGSEDGSKKLICHHCCVPFKSQKFLDRHLRIHANKNKKHMNTKSNLDTIELLEPFMKFKQGKERLKRSTSKKIESLELDDEKMSVTIEEGSGECVDESNDIDDVFDDWLISETKTRKCEAKGYSGVNPKNRVADEYVTEELNPDQYVINYVRSKMLETQRESHRQQFLLSLLPDVQEMNNSQFRSFRHQVCNLIDRVLESDQEASQTSNTSQVSDSSSLVNSVSETQFLKSGKAASQNSCTSQVLEPLSATLIPESEEASFHTSNTPSNAELPS